MCFAALTRLQPHSDSIGGAVGLLTVDRPVDKAWMHDRIILEV
jgi:putative SOS response-associated peptidase YedK